MPWKPPFRTELLRIKLVSSGALGKHPASRHPEAAATPAIASEPRAANVPAVLRVVKERAGLQAVTGEAAWPVVIGAMGLRAETEATVSPAAIQAGVRRAATAVGVRRAATAAAARPRVIAGTAAQTVRPTDWSTTTLAPRNGDRRRGQAPI